MPTTRNGHKQRLAKLETKKRTTSSSHAPLAVSMSHGIQSITKLLALQTTNKRCQLVLRQLVEKRGRDHMPVRQILPMLASTSQSILKLKRKVSNGELKRGLKIREPNESCNVRCNIPLCVLTLSQYCSSAHRNQK